MGDGADGYDSAASLAVFTLRKSASANILSRNSYYTPVIRGM